MRLQPEKHITHWGEYYTESNETKVDKAAETPKILQIKFYRYLQSWTKSLE